MNFIDKLVIAHKHELAKNEKDAANLAEAIFDRDPKAIGFLNDHADLFGKALRNEDLPDAVIKSASTAVSPVITSIAGNDGLLRNPLGIDMNFMPLYQMAPGSATSDEIRIFDFENLIQHKEYAMGAEIESVPFGLENAERLGIRRFGGGSVVLRMLAKNQARYNVNNILRGHQLAELKQRSNWAYAQVDAAADAAIVAGYVTSFATNIVTSVNNGYQAMVTRLDANKYQITDDTPMILVLHATHRPAMQAALRTIIGDNGTNTLLEYPVSVVYTWNSNILTQYDGADAGILILPERKNVWGEFDAPRIEQERKPRTDGIDLVYQYHFNSQLSTLQTQVVKIR
jgi:hypothetical protein